MNSRTYNSNKQSLILQQIQALDSLQNVYKEKIVNFITPFLKANPSDIYDYVSTLFPAFNRPFQLTAGQLGQQVFFNRRQQAQQFTGYSKDFAFDFRDFSKETDNIFNSINPISSLTGILTNFKQQKVGAAETALRLQSLTNLSITNSTREIFKFTDSNDTFSTHSLQMRARGEGCVFCQLMATKTSGTGRFHNFCNCQIDTTFRGEPKFTQPFQEKILEDEEKAKEIIRRGDAGERTIQVGSREWKTLKENEIAKEARAFRKSRNYSPAKNAAVRELYSSYIPKLVNKLGRGQELEHIDLLNLKQWGFIDDIKNPDLSTLISPIQKTIDTTSTKNIIYTIQNMRNNTI